MGKWHCPTPFLSPLAATAPLLNCGREGGPKAEVLAAGGQGRDPGLWLEQDRSTLTSSPALPSAGPACQPQPSSVPVDSSPPPLLTAIKRRPGGQCGVSAGSLKQVTVRQPGSHPGALRDPMTGRRQGEALRWVFIQNCAAGHSRKSLLPQTDGISPRKLIFLPWVRNAPGVEVRGRSPRRGRWRRPHSPGPQQVPQHPCRGSCDECSTQPARPAAPAAAPRG